MNILTFPLRKDYKSTHRAFTLIELSITLVIIGLIVGGVMVGSDMIKAAEVRSQISQIEKYESAVNLFKIKYGNECLPGDCWKLVNLGFSHRWGGSLGLGDSNEILQQRYQLNSYSQLLYGDEFVLFWNDLTRANLIAEGLDPTISYLNWSCYGADRDRCYPKSKLTNDYMYIINRDAYNYYIIGQLDTTPSVLPSSAISPLQSFAYDEKVDDGIPLTGRVQSLQVGVYHAVPDVASATGCINSATTYNTSSTYGARKLCALRIQTGFN